MSNPLPSYQLITAHSMGANFTSAVQKCEFQSHIGVQLIWTGAPTGTFGVSFSNSYVEGQVPDLSTFTPITAVGTAAPAGAAGSAYLIVANVPASYYVVTYTFTSGSGTVNCFVAGK